MLVQPEAAEKAIQPLPRVAIAGVHHTARPTWKLAETVHFYREVMGLDLLHAISARGWGPEDHPDFLHFFFGSGRESTIAFFYYLNTDPPEEELPPENWLYRAVHTAWRVEDRQTLLDWRERFERQGLEVLQVSHEILESIYVTDPNGYLVEICWQMREMDERDAIDSELTLRAAIEFEARISARLETIDDVWRTKAALISEMHRGSEARA